MQCKDCQVCVQGWFRRQPDAFVCVGVRLPFVIEDINAQCSQYEEKQERDEKEKCEN